MTGRKRTCECGSCDKCLHRRYVAAGRKEQQIKEVYRLDLGRFQFAAQYEYQVRLKPPSERPAYVERLR